MFVVCDDCQGSSDSQGGGDTGKGLYSFYSDKLHKTNHFCWSVSEEGLGWDVGSYNVFTSVTLYLAGRC